MIDRDYLSAVAPADFATVQRGHNFGLIPRLKRLGPTLLAMVAALAAILLVIRLPGPLYVDPGRVTFLLTMLVSFPLILLFTLGLHEGGHVAGAALGGLEFILVTVGPFRLARELRGIRLTFVRHHVMQWQGNAFCIARRDDHLRGRLLVFLLGGPAATLGQTAVTLLLRQHLANTILPFWMAQALLLLAYCPLAILPFTLFPMRFHGITTDAAQIIALLRDRAGFAQRAALHLLIAASIRGTRPSAWNQTYLDLLCQPLPDRELSAVGCYLAHIQALDTGAIALAGKYLDQALRLLIQQETITPLPAYLLAAASFEAQYGRDTAVARQWLDLVRPEKYNALSAETAQIYWQTHATLCLEEGNLEQARAAACRSLDLLPHTIDRGYATFAQDGLEQILRATAVAQPAPLDKHIQWSENVPWTAVGRYAVLLALMIFVGMGIGAVWQNGLIPLPASRAQHYYQTGQAHLENGRYPLAIEDFNQAIRLDKHLAAAYWGRGQAYFAQEQHTQAIADFDQALHLQGSQPNPWIYFFRGLSHTHLAHYPEARADFQRLSETATDQHLLTAAATYLREIDRLSDQTPTAIP